MYDREDSNGYRVVDEWADGVGWQAHPEEGGLRTSHAIHTAEGVWLLDPLDAPGVGSPEHWSRRPPANCGRWSRLSGSIARYSSVYCYQTYGKAAVL